MTISAIITAAGKNSRMREDQISRNLEIRNKLILPFNDKTVLETTIDNTLSANIDDCIVVPKNSPEYADIKDVDRETRLKYFLMLNRGGVAMDESHLERVEELLEDIQKDNDLSR